MLGMDLYGLQTSDFFRIDDLLDFTNDELFSSTTTDSGNLPPPEIASGNRSLAASGNRDQPNTFHSADFTDDLCVPVSITLLPQNKTLCPTFFFSFIFFGGILCDFCCGLVVFSLVCRVMMLLSSSGFRTSWTTHLRIFRRMNSPEP